jgi:hypothetical protein
MVLLCVWQLGIATALAQPQAPAAAPLPDGTIKTVQGQVTVIHDNMQSTAVVGALVRSSDRIQTGVDSAAAITLADGTIMSIGPNSVVELQSFRFDPATNDGNVLVNVVRGTLRMVTGMIAKVKPEQVKVTTPTTVIGVRGTDFIVEVNP